MVDLTTVVTDLWGMNIQLGLALTELRANNRTEAGDAIRSSQDISNDISKRLERLLKELEGFYSEHD